jgi:hypothetical protein
MGLEANSDKHASRSTGRETLQDSSQQVPDGAPQDTPVETPVETSIGSPSTSPIQQLHAPRTVSRNGVIFLGNVEKFLGKFHDYRVSAFIQNANYQLDVSEYRWFRNMLLLNEFFKGTKCQDSFSRSQVVDEVFDRVVALVAGARYAERSWYRGLLEKAALKREAEAKKELKKRGEASEPEYEQIPLSPGESPAADSSQEVVQPSTTPPSPPTDAPVTRTVPTKIEFNPEVLSNSVLHIPLSVRTQNLLFPHTNRIRTIRDLLHSSADVFRNVSGVGDKTLIELREGLMGIHPPLGILFDPVTDLPISEGAIGAIVRLSGDPAPRCFALLFQDFTKLSKAGVPRKDLGAIYDAFQRNGFKFKAPPKE